MFQLAKQLGVPSKELVVALNELGLVKVAQSSLTRAESERLLDALADPAQPVPAPATSEAAAEIDEKIRRRVRKDVENEIHQIEQKVDQELDPGESAPGGPHEPVEPDGPDGAAPEQEDVGELLTNVEPEVTPAPEGTEPPAYVPLFKAPTRGQRRRAARARAQEDEDRTRGEGADDSSVPTASSAPSAAAQPGENAADSSAHEGGSSGADEAVEVIDEPKAIRGSSRLEAQRRRRSEKREEDRKRSKIVSQAEFLARRESVERVMVVRERPRHDGPGTITQVGVLEDGVLAEHFVTSEANSSMIGNIYLGRVQNVLPSMEAAFIDIGQGRNGVLYAGEVDWKAAGLGGRTRRIEQALKSGDQVIVQVTKDPIGHKGARLTTQISLAGRYLVYVPGGRSAGISRKLPAPERKRLKDILAKVVPGKGGAIIRTAAEGVPEEAIGADVARLHTQWETIQDSAEREKASKGAKPVTLYEEPNLLVKVVRDLFNEDFSALVVDGTRPWNTVHAYVSSVAPDLVERLVRYDKAENDGQDAFEAYRIDEQIQKALSRTVWLPSGGTLIIERTEAMTVIDVNTGKFTGSGGSLEETVTRNNLEAAEEIVRQMRLRDIGGMIIVDFIDMILPENQELVLRRLKEALGRDRTRHQVSEVTSLGLVQITRKRLGTGLLETFSTTCECCGGRGVVVTEDPVDAIEEHSSAPERGARKKPADDSRERGVSGRASDIAIDEDALDQLAASVIRGDAGAESAKMTHAAQHGEGGRAEAEATHASGGRRRGRRGSGRGKGARDQHGAHGDATALEEPKAPRDEVRDEVPSRGAEERAETRGAATESFEKAVEEFENSPRRRRRTRGNSRSDHRPRPEDFWGESEPEAGQDSGKETSHDTPAQSREPERGAVEEAGRADAPAARAVSATRGRRRAVRRSTASPLAGNESAGKAGAAGVQESSGAERGGVDKREPGTGRGRRRATRRRATRR
nr:Rne/Rng family ribonuclease [Corynebacterium liangguodongii]